MHSSSKWDDELFLIFSQADIRSKELGMDDDLVWENCTFWKMFVNVIVTSRDRILVLV